MFEQQPEDILETLEPTPKERQPGPPFAPSAPKPAEPKTIITGSDLGQEFGEKKKWVAIVIAIVIVVCLAVAAVAVFNFLRSKEPMPVTSPEIIPGVPSVTPELPAASVEIPKVPAEMLDHPVSPEIPVTQDSDNDGLSDLEERDVWKTDPHNSDTDGDGYDDGTEVKGGYNPKGEGKMGQ